METESVIIDDAFKQEIGANINTVIRILNKGGITAEEITDITKKFRDVMADEIEKRKIPHEYRFLLLNVIFCTLFKTTVTFHKKFMTAIEEIQQNERQSKIDK